MDHPGPPNRRGGAAGNCGQTLTLKFCGTPTRLLVGSSFAAILTHQVIVIDHKHCGGDCRRHSCASTFVGKVR